MRDVPMPTRDTVTLSWFWTHAKGECSDASNPTWATQHAESLFEVLRNHGDAFGSSLSNTLWNPGHVPKMLISQQFSLEKTNIWREHPGQVEDQCLGLAHSGQIEAQPQAPECCSQQLHCQCTFDCEADHTSIA